MEDRGALTVGGHVIDVQWDGEDQVLLFNLRLSTGLSHTLRFNVPPENPEDLVAAPKQLKRKKPEEGEDEDVDKVLKDRLDDVPAQQAKRMKMDEEGESDGEANEINATPTINILPTEIVSVILHHASKSSKKVMWVVGRMVCRLWKDLLPAPDPHKRIWLSRNDVARGAAKGGHLEVLKWLREIYPNRDWGFGVTAGAAKGGRLEILKWLREQGADWSMDTCAYAAKKGHLDVLKWLRENGCPWNRLTCIMAAHQGHLEVVQWARLNGCAWALTGKSSNACLFAAIGGHLEVLKWLRENGCPWTSATCFAAAAHGHFELLKWARENGCPCTAYSTMAAATRGDIEVLRWLMQNACFWDMRHGIEWPKDDRDGKGINYNLKHVHRFGGDSIAFIGALDVLKFAFETGSQLDEPLH